MVSDVHVLALRLYGAIVNCRYQEIEDLVDAGRDQELLSLTDSKGNTFLHLCCVLCVRRHRTEFFCLKIGNPPSSPKIHHVSALKRWNINISYLILLNKRLFIHFI